MGQPVLVLLQRSRSRLVLTCYCILQLHGVISHALLTAELASCVSREDGLLLKVDQDVKGVVELGRNVVAVMVAGVFLARVTLHVRVIAGAEHGSLDLTSTLNSVRQLLNAVEAVVNTARRARSDGVRHGEDRLRDLVVPRASQHLFRTQKAGDTYRRSSSLMFREE
jgi:hypothetical protein